MPRAKGDHEARRLEVSEAVWRVLATRGFGGLTLRAVATELGATTGLLTHYFPAKSDLLAHALDLLEQRTAARARRTSAGPRGRTERPARHPAADRGGHGLQPDLGLLLGHRARRPGAARRLRREVRARP